MKDHTLEMTIEQLAEHAGVSVRTVRFYISEGLLPGPGSRGRAATYGEEHLLRLRLIRLLVDQRVPLAEIGARLSHLSLAEVRAVLADEAARAAERARAAQQLSPKDYVAALLRQPQRAPRPVGRPEGDGLLRLYDAGPHGMPGSPPAAAPTPPPVGWLRWELAPGVEMHVRSDVAQRERRLIDRVLELARELRKPES